MKRQRKDFVAHIIAEGFQQEWVGSGGTVSSALQHVHHVLQGVAYGVSLFTGSVNITVEVRERQPASFPNAAVIGAVVFTRKYLVTNGSYQTESEPSREVVVE
jgi:hypothetical protein